MQLSFRRFVVLALGAAIAVAQCAVRAQAAPDTLGKVRAAKQIDVAYSTDSPPFSFAGEGKRPTGYSIEIGRGEQLWTSHEDLLDRFHLESVPSPSGITHLLFWRR